MPSLVRFLIVIAVLAGLVYGVMLALVTFVEPVPRPMEQAVPAAKLNPPKAGTATP
ncbi:histidine kinase [Lichenibacterium dinghuense]|uniref:histidine kinase n=1 Tax=Lichenibacterium dinghuense TaxID=2895977 RepID=UPI001F312F38|nr:histidine kinase [Lichenibacterium sp. 6Y81]